MKKLTAILLIITLCLSGCTGKIFGGNNTEQQSSSPVHGNANTTADDMGVQEFTFPAYSEIFTERDKAGTYDESEAVYITCSTDGFECADNTVTVKMNSCIIQKEGVYVVSGNCDNGQICVNAPENAKVQIVLAGLSLSSETSSAILIKSAKKVFITLAQGTENTLSDGEVYNTASNEDAVIFSKADLTLNGSGTLNLTGNYQHACVSKDDLTVTGGTYDITAKASGLSAKDAVEICGGDIRVQAGTDAVRAKNDEDSTKGNVFIYGGSFTLHSQGDGISASANMLIEDGKFDIKTAGGSDEVEQNMGNGRKRTDSENENEKSTKAIKAGNIQSIRGGDFTVSAKDDALHSDGNSVISGGNFRICTGDDAIHAKEKLQISGASIVVEKCYEGLEAVNIDISGGEVIVNAGDDGINSNGDEMEREGQICVSGGYVYLTAGGDGIDSNGSIFVKGGTLLVCGSENDGNSSMDYASKAVVTGGIIMACGSSGMSVNFGSESTQCAFLCNMNSVSANTRISCLDESGKVIASFLPQHRYSSVIVSTPELEVGKSYVLFTGGEADKADKYGFVSKGILKDGSELGKITLTKTVSTFGNGKGNAGKMP